METSWRTIAILIALIIVLGLFGSRAFINWKSTAPGEYNTIVFTCQVDGVVTEYPSTILARPACSKCGGQVGKIERVFRENQPAPAQP